MFLKILKNSEKYYWTEHAKFKIKFYGLSPQRVLRVIRAPERIEKGIVEKTIAVMQPASRRRVSASRGGPAREIWSQEIWAMYQTIKSPKSKVQSLNEKLLTINQKPIKIISAWRYPGMSPKDNPIPEEILSELEGII